MLLNAVEHRRFVDKKRLRLVYTGSMMESASSSNKGCA